MHLLRISFIFIFLWTIALFPVLPTEHLAPVSVFQETSSNSVSKTPLHFFSKGIFPFLILALLNVSIVNAQTPSFLPLDYIESLNPKVIPIKTSAKSINATNIEELLLSLDDRDPKVRAAAVWRSEVLQITAVVDKIISLLSDPHPAVREATAQYLGNLKVVTAVNQLLPLLDDTDPDVREAAIKSTWQLVKASNNKDIFKNKNPEIIEKLQKRFDDIKNPSLRLIIIKTFIELEESSGFERLVELFQDETLDSKARSAIIWELVNLKAPGIIELLEKLLQKEKNSEVRKTIEEALEKLNAPSVIEPEKPPSLVQEEQLQKSGDNSDAVKSVIKLLEQPALRAAAAAALGYMKDPRAIPELLKHLNDPDPRVRVNVVLALGELRDPSVLKEIISLWKDEDEEVKKAVINVLLNSFGVHIYKYEGTIYWTGPSNIVNGAA
jgi:HEAT repeat protein